MFIFWSLLAMLAGLAGARYVVRLNRGRTRNPPIDDAAVRRIIAGGTLADEEEPVDLDEAARAEEEFWSESWDEPEEFQR